VTNIVLLLLCESEATASTNVLTVRKRSDSIKAPSGTEINPRYGDEASFLFYYENALSKVVL